MGSFKVIFLLPAYFGSNHSLFLGVGYLAAAVKNCGHRAIVIDEDAITWIYSQPGTPDALEQAQKRVLAEIETYNPNMLCISINTANYKNALRLLRYVRNKFPEIFMVVGGPHISTCYDTFRSWHGDLFDAAIIGEGEVSLCALIESLKAGQPKALIPGVCYAAGEPSNLTGSVVDIRKLPFPDRAAFFEIYDEAERALAMENYSRVFYSHLPGFENGHARVVASRGCYNHCTFCSPGVYWRDPQSLKPCRRLRDPESILDEVESLLASGIQAIYFDDPTFPIKSDLRFFTKFEAEIQNRGLHFHWGAPICSSEVDGCILDRLQKIGFSYTYFGLENYKEEHLKSFQKHQDIQQCLALIDECKKRAIHCDASYQIGLPNETMEDIKRSVDWIFQNHIERNTFYSITAIWPSTALAETYGVLPAYYEPNYPKKMFEEKSGLFFYEQGDPALEQFYSNCSGTYHFIPMELAKEIKYYLFDCGLTNRFRKKNGV